jgi:hypothetical protein
MFLGRAQQGETLIFFLQCLDADEVEASPSAPPQIKIWNPAGALALSGLMPAFERFQSTGLFYFNLFLGSSYSTTGNWAATFDYTVSAHHGFQSDTFEIIPGGHADGHVVGMYHYRRPHADFLVHQTESGTLVKGRNPRTP